ncbi:aspartate--tRNA ligase [Candidatus Woesearchaeota archaeon]|nr:aspartate--tRNA ligase [Candidatus Woesearchaeota archaeon]
MHRTHTCGELQEANVEEAVTLSGWVSKPRDHGGVIFVDLRDRHGITQAVFNPEIKDFKEAEKLRREDVIKIEGVVKKRKEGMENQKVKTGKIEVVVNKLSVFSKADTPPIETDERVEANEDMRLKYRYLDLRRPNMQKHLAFRHQVITAAREHFNKEGFLEIETPLFVKSTPEGARDYVVPSRVNPGEFYALPQSPQLYKQILMIAGMDRYYQVARCLRDEDLRADRQPEHTQFDFEMSFVEQKDILEFTEGLYKYIFKKTLNITLPKFPIFTYDEAMNKYSTDKPDIRFDLFTTDVSKIVKKSDFGVFKSVVESGGLVKVLNPNKDFSRTELDKYINYAQTFGAKGMAWMRVTKDGLESNIAKYFSKAVQEELIKQTNAKPGSTLMFIADKKSVCNDIIGRLRIKLGEDLELYDKKEFRFCWVNDFPLFSYNEDDERWEPEHHMFSMPNPEYVKDFEKRPEVVTGDLWDLVLNGIEVGSGSIRVSNPKVQERIMNFIGLDKKEAHEKFGFLLEAYKYGGPPHGGMGLGVDRSVALMLGTNDIREVIAFPKNKAAQCPMDGSPSKIDEAQLKELHLKLEAVKKK